MGKFNKFGGGDRGGKRFGGGRRDFGGRSGGDRQMFSAVCEECGKSCEVPFRQTGDRPVFCSDCFKAQRGGGSSFAPKSFGGKQSFAPKVSAGISKGQVDLIISKLDKILSILAQTKGVSEKVELKKAIAEVKVAPEARVEKKVVAKVAAKKEKKVAKKVKSRKK